MKKLVLIMLMCFISVAFIAFRSQAASNREDCIRYNADSLRIVDEGERGWLLTDGRSRMVMLDNQDDAEAALDLARQHSYQCYIGRNNRRPDRKGYIIEYWK